MTVIQGPKGSTVTKHERRKNMRDRQLGSTNDIRIEFLKKRINKEDLHSGKLQKKFCPYMNGAQLRTRQKIVSRTF